jgi:hypothetical protein
LLGIMRVYFQQHGFYLDECNGVTTGCKTLVSGGLA